MFQLPILAVVERLEPGQASESFEFGKGIAAVRLNAREEDPRIGFDDMREIVAARIAAGTAMGQAQPPLLPARRTGIEGE